MGQKIGIFTIILIVLTSVFTSCRTCRYSNIETNRSDTLYMASHIADRAVSIRTDSIVIRDSVAMVISGDTVRIENWHWRDRVKADIDTIDRWRTRTVYKTISKRYTVKIKQPLEWWQKSLMWIGIIFVIGFVVRLIIRSKTQN